MTANDANYWQWRLRENLGDASGLVILLASRRQGRSGSVAICRQDSGLSGWSVTHRRR